MAGKLGRALVLLVLLAAALITQAPLAVFLLAFALVLLVLLRLDAAYLRRQVTAELLVPDKPVIQGEDFTLTVRLRNRSRLPIPALVVLLNAADEWGGGQITLRCAAMLGGKESAEQRITLNAGKSGVWSIAVRGITLRDHLGVFTAACPAAVQSQSICVLPAAAAGKAKAETAPDEDGDEADTRAALGGSYELREYRDGDTIKQVHWKLSAKLDRLMVREPLTALRAALTPGGDLDGAEEWGDFPQQAAKHRKNPPKRKKERTALSRRGAADPGSGLKFVDRVLVSTQRPAAHPALWLAADAALLLALTFGLLLVLSTGFGIAVPLWVWPAAAAFCAGWALFLRAPQALRRWGLLAGVIVYLVVLFICQRNFLAGAQQCAGNIAQSLNARLGSALPVAQGGSAAQLGLFLLLLGPLMWFGIVYFGSLLTLLWQGFYTFDDFTMSVTPELTLANIRALFNPANYDIIVRTLTMAVAVTIASAILAFPMAWYMARYTSGKMKAFFYIAVMLPMWASYIVKAYAWTLLLAKDGVAQWFLQHLGLEPLLTAFLTLPAVGGNTLSTSGLGRFLVFLYIWLPFMILPVQAALERLPPSLLQASADLGARPRQTFRYVVLPLAIPGIAAGSIFTFSLTLGDFIVPQLVGPPGYFIGNMVYSQQGAIGNMPMAAAFTLVPIVLIALYLAFVKRLGAFDAL